MSVHWWTTLLVATTAAVGHGWLAWWSWRTPNGRAWRFYCIANTCQACVYAVWVSNLLAEPMLYQTIRPTRALTYAFVIMSAAYHAALGMALYRERRAKHQLSDGLG